MFKFNQTKFFVKNKEAAFTLLELLVVMAILAILTVIGLSSFGTIREKSRDSRRKQDLQAVAKSLEAYYNDFGRYPLSEMGVMMACGPAAAEACVWGEIWQNSDNDTLYMVELPQDPTGNRYYYMTDENGSYYQLFAYLENDDDIQAARTTGDEVGFYQNTSCHLSNQVFLSNSCNYVLMSSNMVNKPSVVNE